MGKLSSLIKDLELNVVEVSDESTADTEVYKITLANELTAKGSNVLPDGKPMVMTGREVWIAAEDIQKFEENFDDAAKTYKGKLKLDVSKPNGRVVNGVFTVTKAPKIWLTAIPFNKRGQALVNDRRGELNKMMVNLFGGGAVSTGAVTTTGTTGVNNTTTVADEKAVEMADGGANTPTGTKTGK